MKWCNINKWLYIGNFIIRFDDWFWRSYGEPKIRHWELFSIYWDNSAWYPFRPEDAYIELTIFGISIRWWYNGKND